MGVGIAQITDDGDLILQGGIFGASSIEYPAGSIDNADISSIAAIAASKCQRNIERLINQEGSAVTRRFTVRHVLGATATLKHFRVSNGTSCSGASTVTVDLQKNGVSVLAAVVTLNSSTVVNTPVTGTISSLSLIVGDRLDIVITTNQSGTDVLAQDIMAQVDFDEDYKT